MIDPVGQMSEQGMPGVQAAEVAAFVDFENIRYSTINAFGREPDPIVWRDKALSYGLMAVARAYATAKQINPNPPGIRTAEERAILFGQSAATLTPLQSVALA